MHIKKTVKNGGRHLSKEDSLGIYNEFISKWYRVCVCFVFYFVCLSPCDSSAICGLAIYLKTNQLSVLHLIFVVCVRKKNNFEKKKDSANKREGIACQLRFF